MPKKQDVIVGVVFYGLMLLWAVVFTATMWRLNVLDGPHWLKLCYLVLVAVWMPVTTVFLVYLRKQSIIDKEWGFRLVTWAFYVFCAVILAFIGLSIADHTYGVS